VKIWTLGPLALLAALCLAPSDCEGNPVPEPDAAVDGAAGDAATQRTLYSSADCQKRGECSIALGAQFSQTECTTNNQEEGERADSVGCTPEYDAFLACVAGLTYDCAQPVDLQITARCGGLYNALTSCVSN